MFLCLSAFVSLPNHSLTHLTTVCWLLQGLRKSSDCGRIKRTIVPHSVPHMVRLRKFIVSEDAVFLLLQYAEGKDLLLAASASSLLFPPLSSFPIHLSLPLSWTDVRLRRVCVTGHYSEYQVAPRFISNANTWAFFHTARSRICLRLCGSEACPPPKHNVP